MISPTIVLVHGALTGASVWSRVIARLRNDGHNVIAPALPLRGLASDAVYLASFLETIDGPIVLAGHSYGGSIISHPVIAGCNVAALVFVSAFAPDTGESTADLNARWPGSKLNETTTIVRNYPGGSDLYLQPERFGEVYADDLDQATIEVMAASQRPIEVRALAESFDGSPRWKHVVSYMLVSTRDASLPAKAQRCMAKRANASAVEVAASHASPVSRPEAVADLIAGALTAAMHER